MKYLGVFTSHSFKDNMGVEQKKWYKAGYVKESTNGGQYLRLFHQPQTSYYIFDKKQEKELPDVYIA